MVSVMAPFFAEREIPPALLVEYFRPREEELELLERRVNQKQGTLTVVQAPVGHGRSTLLSALGHRIHSRHPGLPFVGLHANRVLPSGPGPLLQRIRERLASPGAAPVSAAASPAVPASWEPLRRQLPKDGLVLVLDDADAAMDAPGLVLPPLVDLVDRARFHAVLVTGPRDLPPQLSEARLVTLPRWARRESDQVLRSGFIRAGLDAPQGYLDLCWEHAKGIPFHTQLLGLKTWEEARIQGKSRLTEEDFATVLSKALDALPPPITGQLSVVGGQARDVLGVMATRGLTTPTDIARAIGVEPKNAVVLLARLAESHRLVEREGRGRYRIADPFLEDYLKREYANPEF